MIQRRQFEEQRRVFAGSKTFVPIAVQRAGQGRVFRALYRPNMLVPRGHLHWIFSAPLIADWTGSFATTNSARRLSGFVGSRSLGLRSRGLARDQCDGTARPAAKGPALRRPISAVGCVGRGRHRRHLPSVPAYCCSFRSLEKIFHRPRPISNPNSHPARQSIRPTAVRAGDLVPRKHQSLHRKEKRLDPEDHRMHEA